MFIFPVQLTTSRIGNLTRLIHTLLYVMTIHTYIHTYIHGSRLKNFDWFGLVRSKLLTPGFFGLKAAFALVD